MSDSSDETPDPMSTTISAKFESWWKAGSILVGCIVLGGMIVATIGTYIQLPGELDGFRAKQEALNTRLTAIESARALEAQQRAQYSNDLDERLERLECLLIASRKQTSWEDCL